MKLTIFNGSPRGKKSNTKILLETFLQGFTQGNDNSYELEYLVYQKNLQENVNKFKKAETVLIAFPLYVDSMPSIVKDFIEALDSCKGQSNNPALIFFVQSGFPEAVHSRAVEKYLAKLSKRLNSQYIGTILKGGIEGIQSQPKWMRTNVYQTIYQTGKYFARNNKLDKNQLKKFAQPEKFNLTGRIVFEIMDLFGLIDSFWNNTLKENNAYDKRFAKPYKEKM